MARWNFAKEAMSSTKADRKMLAAKAALDLMLSHGDKAPSLTKGGPYVRLASLLYFTATGKRNRLARNCKKRFDDLKASGFDFSLTRGQGRAGAGHLPGSGSSMHAHEPPRGTRSAAPLGRHWSKSSTRPSATRNS